MGESTFLQAYRRARGSFSNAAWAATGPRDQTIAIYRAMREIDEESSRDTPQSDKMLDAPEPPKVRVTGASGARIVFRKPRQDRRSRHSWVPLTAIGIICPTRILARTQR
jgi:hypothetical protein